MTLQYIREVSLTVGEAGKTYDLSNLHIQFHVVNATTSTLKYADIRIWNLAPQTAAEVQKEFTSVSLKAGYKGNSGLIFQGQICRVAIGREDSVNSYCDLFCQDGDLANNWSVTNGTLSDHWTADDLYNRLMQDFAAHGVSAGYKPEFSKDQAPCGRSLYGPTRELMTQLAESQNCDWFIENGAVQIVPKKGYLPSATFPRVSAASGLIGNPVQTIDGINARCLLNPSVVTGGVILLDNSSINTLEQHSPRSGESLLLIPSLDQSSRYKTHCVSHTGDTRENDWYTDMICVAMDGTVAGQGAAFVDVPSGN